MAARALGLTSRCPGQMNGETAKAGLSPGGRLISPADARIISTRGD